MNERLTRAGTLRTLRLDDVLVTYVPDGAVQLQPRRWFPGSSAADWIRYAGYVDASGHLAAGIGSLLIQRGERAMLVDTGFGPQRIPATGTIAALGSLHGGSLLENLNRLGVAADQIDVVAFTHLHDDHVGWARHRDAPFTGARFVTSEAEWAAAGRPAVEPVADGVEVFPGVRLVSLPGHTAGHAGYRVTGGRQRLLAFGDALHSPVQIRHPDWGAVSDVQPELAHLSRRRVVEELLVPSTIGFGNHFADVVFGRVETASEGPAWTPLA